MKNILGPILTGLACAVLAACTTAAPESEVHSRRGVSSSPYAYLDGLVEVPGGFELYSELDDPGVAMHRGPNVQWPEAWRGPIVELRLDGSDGAYELTEDVPSLCACPQLAGIDESYDFLYEVGEPLRSGYVPIHFDVFWTIGAPTIRFELVVIDGNGERVLGAVEHRFDYPWRHDVELGMYASAAGVTTGDLLSLRLTLVDAVAASPSWVFNAGPGDLASTVGLPVE